MTLTSTPKVKLSSKVRALAFLSMASGIINIGFGLFWIVLGLKIFLVGVLFTIIPGAYCLTVGTLNVFYASKLLPAKDQAIKPAKYLAGMDVCSFICMNWLSFALGIINLFLYGDEEVKRYFKTGSKQ